jgi:DNA repair protein RadC
MARNSSLASHPNFPTDILLMPEDQDRDRVRERREAPILPGKIHDIPKTERPREKLTTHGAGALTGAELLAIFFRTGLQGLNAIDMSRNLIEKYGSLQALSRLSVEELSGSNRGIGPAKAAELVAVFEMGRRLAHERLADIPLNEPDLIYELVSAEMQQLSKESLRVLLLNTRLRLVKMEIISTGTLNETVAHPRDILHPVLIHQCHGFVLLHNHPSGDPTPSAADRRFTRRVKEAADLMRLEMLDHVIIGHPSGHAEGTGYFSFRENGIV